MTAPPVQKSPSPGNGAFASPALVRELFGPNANAGDSPDESTANQITAPNPPDDSETVEPLSQLRSLMAALYGSDFPLLRALDEATAGDENAEATGQMPPLETLLKYTTHDEWSSWVRGRWGLHRSAVELHLYLVARNRLFRAGQQWVSSSGREPWRAPPRPAEQARVVHNMIAPALDQRIQVIADQRPGFQVDPTSLSPDEKRKAQGRQQALEFQFDQQKMDRQIREAAYWAGTDGVAFWEVYWDRDTGPLDERMGANGQKKPLGDLRTKTRRCEQVRVSANATASEPPYYAVVRDVIPETEAAYLYGAAGVQNRSTTGDLAHSGNDTSGTGADGIMPSWVLTQTIVGEGNRLTNMKTVERFTLYVDKHPDILPDGLQVVVVGNAVVWGPGELLFGRIPLVRFADGSTDPSYFCRPLMEYWIPPQMRVNAALSLWVNSVRVNSGGRFLSRPDAISRETFIGSGCSILEVQGPGPLGDSIQPINGFLVGNDVKELIAFDVKAFEDMSGFNDVSRGQISTETATAVAVANEQLQRVFAPPVEAAATACQEWGEINLAGMRWGYDIARDVGAIGTDRPDLARALSSKDFEGDSRVIVEAAKMMPMPKVFRMAIWDDMLAKGVITNQQYLRNHEFASLHELGSPDEDQTARAKRVADALRMGQPLPPLPPLPNAPPPPPDSSGAPPPDPAQMAAQPLALRWQTNEAIEQDILERDILLQDDLPPEVMIAAAQRWAGGAAQAAAKQGPASNSDEKTWQQFKDDIAAQATAKAEQVVAGLVEQQSGLGPSQTPPPTEPPAPDPMALEEHKTQQQIALETAKHQLAMQAKDKDAEIASASAANVPTPAPAPSAPAGQLGTPPTVIVPPPDFSELAQVMGQVMERQNQLLEQLIQREPAPVVVHHEASPQAAPIVHVHPQVSSPPQPAPIVHVDAAKPEAPKKKKKRGPSTIKGPDGATYTIEHGEESD